MRLQVTVRHGQVNDAIRGYVETKFRKLERRLHDATQIDVVLDRERNLPRSRTTTSSRPRSMRRGRRCTVASPRPRTRRRPIS